MPKYEFLCSIAMGNVFEGGIDELIKKGLVREIPETPKRWKPEVGEGYFFVNDGGDVREATRYYNNNFEENDFNIWRTREEADSAAEKTRELWLSLHEEKKKEYQLCYGKGYSTQLHAECDRCHRQTTDLFMGECSNCIQPL